MKQVIVLSLLVLFATHSFAYTLDERIAAIKSASPEKRLELMNNLKRSIAKLNSQQRMRAIRRLRAKIAPHTLSHHEISDVVHSNLDVIHSTHNDVMEHKEILQEHLQKEEQKLQQRIEDEVHKQFLEEPTKELIKGFKQ